MGTIDSIVTGYSSICFFCGKPAECEHHLLFGNGKRKLAEEDGLKGGKGGQGVQGVGGPQAHVPPPPSSHLLHR